jgi:hypothetical protein
VKGREVVRTTYPSQISPDPDFRRLSPNEPGPYAVLDRLCNRALAGPANSRNFFLCVNNVTPLH